jgi:hypothetical protein
MRHSADQLNQARREACQEPRPKTILLGSKRVNFTELGSIEIKNKARDSSNKPVKVSRLKSASDSLGSIPLRSGCHWLPSAR